MDPVSTTLSVIPLVLQLGKGLFKLSGLLQSIQEAPSEIEWIIEELDFLDTILNQIKLNDELYGTQLEVQRALRRCLKPLQELGDIAESFAPGFASGSIIRRKWTAIEVVRQKEQAQQFKDRLADANTTLIIVQNLSSRYRPSALMVRFGVKALQMSTQGWQAKLRFFNLIPKDSLIFDFCRTGNIDAVRVLLQKGLASIDDMNEFNETPLHIAAGYCQADVCALLLSGGADTDAEDRCGETPFHRACAPTYATPGSMSSRMVITMTQEQVIPTLHKFLRGKDLEEGDSYGRGLKLLTLHEMMVRAGDSNSDNLFQWNIDKVLPVTRTHVLGDEWWDSCITSMLYLWPGHPYFTTLLSKSSKQAARASFISFIDALTGGTFTKSFMSGETDLRQAIFDDFSESCGGVSFLGEDSGDFHSPLSKSMRTSVGFTKLRSLLKSSKYDVADLVRHEVELHGQGWTTKSLLTLFESDFVPFEDLGNVDCKSCSFKFIGLTQLWEYPWQQMVRRIKRGIKLDSPLSKEERRCQKSWQRALKAFKSGTCFACYSKKDKLALIMSEKDNWYL
ncbi:hypothetical protein IFR05_014764 [Cadophora sp. M221]|nr:hypothetical protein IFR05_014764 [Cadophora sp. M221]